MTRADAWIHFASAAILNGYRDGYCTTPDSAAKVADALLKEFDDRFGLAPTDSGQFIAHTSIHKQVKQLAQQR